MTGLGTTRLCSHGTDTSFCPGTNYRSGVNLRLYDLQLMRFSDCNHVKRIRFITDNQAELEPYQDHVKNPLPCIHLRVGGYVTCFLARIDCKGKTILNFLYRNSYFWYFLTVEALYVEGRQLYPIVMWTDFFEAWRQFVCDPKQINILQSFSLKA